MKQRKKNLIVFTVVEFIERKLFCVISTGWPILTQEPQGARGVCASAIVHAPINFAGSRPCHELLIAVLVLKLTTTSQGTEGLASKIFCSLSNSDLHPILVSQLSTNEMIDYMKSLMKCPSTYLFD